MKRTLSLIFLLLSFTATQAQPTQPPRCTAGVTATFTELAPLSVGGPQGVSAPFAGTVAGSVWVAGGCNFPDVPAAEGGPKRFYSDVYVLHRPYEAQARWEKAGELPRPLAYGVSVSVPDGLVLIGGTDGRQSCPDVWLMQQRRSKPTFTPLPPLPTGLDNMAGAYGSGYIYVAGGQTDGAARSAAYRMRYPGGKAWERLPDFPGDARVQPVAAVQQGATGEMFCLIGGFAPASAGKDSYTHTDGVAYCPHSGTWQPLAPIALPDGSVLTLTGAQALPLDSTHILCMGGVNAEVFNEAVNRPARIRALRQAADTAQAATLAALEQADRSYLKHPAPWYRFNDRLLLYNTSSDTWSCCGRSPLLARAGAALVAYADGWIVVNGESKPGIRSAAVSGISLQPGGCCPTPAGPTAQ